MMDDYSSSADEAQIYAAVHGVTPSGGRADELGTYLQSIRSGLCTPPDAQTRWNHLAAMRRAHTGSTKRRKGRGIAAVSIAAVGLVTATTGLAAADRLPRPAQDQIARIAKIVGVDLPGNDAGRAPSQPGDSKHVKASPESVGDVRPGAGAAESTAHAGTGAPPVGSPPALAPQSGIVLPDTGPLGRSGENPAQTGGPATAVTPPSQSGTHPGTSGSAPGHDPSGPGQSEYAPGNTGATPGKSAAAPGHTGATPGNSATAPGPTGATGKLGTPPAHGLNRAEATDARAPGTAQGNQYDLVP